MKKVIGVLASIIIVGCNSHLEDNEKSPKALAGKLNSLPETEMLKSNWDDLKERHLRLLPVPKKLNFTGQEIPADKIAVALSRDTEEGRIAANEITSRIKELTGQDVSIFSKPKDGMYNVIIENKWPNAFTQDRARPSKSGTTEQGYGLYPKKNSIILAGQGKLGMQYAAVTLRWLIGEKNGKIIFYPAQIIVWPDYQDRLVSMGTRFPYMEKYRNSPEKHLKEFKKYVDYLFRIKANRIGTHTYQPYQGAFSPFKAKPDAPEKIIKSIRKVNDYAKLRGIKNLMIYDESLGRKPWQKSPELDKMSFLSYSKIYYSWGRHDLHRIKAKKMGKFCKDAGVSIVYMHSPDTGGIRDPEKWSQRDAWAKKMYPADDDRARADADVFNIYAEMLGKEGIEVNFVQYPYTAKYLNEDDVRNSALASLALPDAPAANEYIKELIAKVEKWNHKVNSLIPLKSNFCVRESSTENIIRFCNSFKNRPMCVYYEVYYPPRDINELLPRELNTLRSSFVKTKPGVKSIMVSTYKGFNESVSACASEYSWNTAFPGWSELDRSKASYIYNPAELDIMAERAAVGLWGAKAGNELKKVFDRLLSIRLAVKPYEIQKNLNLKELEKVHQANHNALLRAEEALDAAWLLKLQAKSENKPFMDKFSYPFFIQYYKMIKGTVPYSIANGAFIQAEETLRNGNLQKTGKILQEALRNLSKSEAEFNRVSRVLKDEPMVYPWSEITSPYYQALPRLTVLNPDFAGLKKRLNELWLNREKIYQQSCIPAWFKGFIKKRPIYAALTKAPIEVDGDLNEQEWGKAVPVEYFLKNSCVCKPSGRPAFAKVLYDNKKLYISGEISQPFVADIKEKAHGADKYVLSASVEFFLIPGAGKPELQFVIDSSGNVFTLKKIKPSKEMLKHQIVAGWDAGLVSAVKKDKGKWRFEMSIPYEKLGAKPGQKWKCMFAYNRVEKIKPRKIESYASSFVDGKGFCQPKFYSTLIFLKKPPLAKPDINVKCTKLNMKDKQHTSGSGSLITFTPELETRRPLANVSIDAIILDKNGKQVHRMKLKDIDYLSLSWTNKKPFQCQLEEMHKGVILQINVNYQTVEGENGKYSKNFILGRANFSKDEIFVPGSNKNKKALAVPVYFDFFTKENKKLLELTKGRISFKFSPSGNFNANVRSCLFHFGPIRRKNPENYNRSSICAIINKGVLAFMITNEKYKIKRVFAKLPKLRKGQWLDFSFSWDLNVNGKTRMEISVDGKKLSKAVKGWKNIDPTSMEVKDEFYTTMQVGALNSGRFPAGGFFENLLFSGKDGASLFFSFNDTLTGKYDIGGVKGELKANAGSLWK